jgi:phosphatidylglycerol:prolipoprotein diacylglycerol transferase
MLVLAFTIATALARRQARKQNIDPDFLFDFGFMVFLSGVIGGRIFYIIENAGYYLKYPLEIIMLQHGGLSWFGGLALGSACGLLYLKVKKLSVPRVLDLVAPFIALAQAIGRGGCLLNGCCFGRVSESGIYFPTHDAVLIPTQIYSSLALIVIFIVLRAMQERPHASGRIFLAYLLLYSLKRFLIEFWRADNAVLFFGLTLFQIISAIIFCVTLAVWFSARKSQA